MHTDHNLDKPENINAFLAMISGMQIPTDRSSVSTGRHDDNDITIIASQHSTTAENPKHDIVDAESPTMVS